MAKSKEKIKSKSYETGAQIAVNADGTYAPGRSKYYRDFDEMDRHPTISLARRIVTALAIREPWTFEGDDPAYCRFVKDEWDRHKKLLIKSSYAGMFKRGWRAFELRFGVVRVPAAPKPSIPKPSAPLLPGAPPLSPPLSPPLGEPGVMRQSLDGVKALRPEFTEQVVSETSGDFIGLMYRHGFGADISKRFIDSAHSLFVNNDEEGFGEYGMPVYDVAWRAWKKWLSSDEGAQRYDDKIAGGFRVVKFPVGKTLYMSGGVLTETDNAQIAEEILRRLKSSGDAMIPVKVIDEVTGTELPKIIDSWKIEHIAAASGGQPSFVIRSKYLDALMMRAFGLPERSATEGTLGTKAEAEAHADIAMLVNHERHEIVAESINEGPLKAFNYANTGDSGACELIIGELDPDSRELFTQIFTTLMQDPALGDEVSRRVDVETMLEKLQIPVRSPEEMAADEAEQALQRVTAPPEVPLPPQPGVPSRNGAAAPRF